MKYFLFLLISVSTFSQVKRFDDNGNLTHYADTLNGMFNGKVIIYNKNKTIAVQGNFIKNQKTGVWIYNDSTGILTNKRIYKNDYEFENVLVKNDTNPKFQIKRNKLKNILFPKVNESEIFERHTEICFVENDKLNSIFFKNDSLFKILKKYINEADTLEVYDDSNFTEKLKINEIYNKIEKFEFEIVGYKLKRFRYYNDKFKIVESRLLGVCPVIKTKEYEKFIDLFWVYFPSINESVTIASYYSLLEKLILKQYSSYYFYENYESVLEKIYNSEETKVKVKDKFIIYNLQDLEIENKYLRVNFRELAKKKKLEYEKEMSKYKKK